MSCEARARRWSKRPIARPASASDRGPNDRLRAVADRTRRGFTNLERALNDAEDAATATRSLAARSLGA